MELLFTLENIDFSYGPTRVLDGLSLTMQKGESLCVMGPNGSGKSTLLKLILGSITPQKGKILQHPDLKIGYVPQMGTERLYSFPITAKEMVGLNLYPGGTRFFKNTEYEEDRISSALRKVNLYDQKDDLFSNLSGGQKQRVLIAKAMVSSPNFLILDEPTIGLDEKSKKGLYHLLRHFNRSHGLSLLVVTHETKGITEICNRKVEMQGGRAVEVDCV